jgi:hypothetical protein
MLPEIFCARGAVARPGEPIRRGGSAVECFGIVPALPPRRPPRMDFGELPSGLSLRVEDKSSRVRVPSAVGTKITGHFSVKQLVPSRSRPNVQGRWVNYFAGSTTQ